MEEKVDEKKDEIIHDFEGEKPKNMFTKQTSILFIFLLIIGIFTGYILSSNKSLSNKISKVNVVSNLGSGSSADKGQIYGSGDEKTFKDIAEGVLKEGGIEGEGQYHLERPGGESQNVYLTSSVLDLSRFLDKKIKVWGQTNSAKKAGWLMDVGKLQVLE